MSRSIWKTVGVLGVVLVSAVVLHAASLNDLLRDADGRRQAAENGLEQIKTKSPDLAAQVRAPYTDAASRHNAWVDAIYQSIEPGAPSAADVSSLVGPAGASLVEWVNARNTALGLPPLDGPVGDTVRRQVEQNLTAIASEAWRSNRGGSQDKRTKAAATLRDRLRWKAFEEVQ